MDAIRPKSLGHALGALFFLTPMTALSAGPQADFETGVVFASRNDVGIPGDTGTSLSLVNDLQGSPAPFFRVRLGYRFGERHLVSVLYAPLRLNLKGSVDHDVQFAGGEYPAGTPLLAVYRFDSYRLTYRYSVVAREDLHLGVGFTGKIRDAEIALYGADDRRKTNTGFVPLLNFHLAWTPRGSAFGLVFDADALAAPQGRAEDVLLAAVYKMSEDITLRAGYRTIEGGADNDEVYTFAWLHYATLGVELVL